LGSEFQQKPAGAGRGVRSVEAMRAVLQRVLSASVEVEGKVVSRIGPGLLCLVGLHAADAEGGEAEATAKRLAKKIVGLRLWEDPATGKPWSQGVVARGYEILLVSQFTLYANCSKGTKPDFSKAMKTEDAAALYSYVLDQVRAESEREGLGADRVRDGVFGAMMKVSLENDGPVTVTLDYPPVSASQPGKPGKGAGRGGGAPAPARPAAAATAARPCSPPPARARSPQRSPRR